jgi:hypothetical protein
MITGYAARNSRMPIDLTVSEVPINPIGESKARGERAGYLIWTRRKPPVYVGVNFDVHVVI